MSDDTSRKRIVAAISLAECDVCLHKALRAKIEPHKLREHTKYVDDLDYTRKTLLDEYQKAAEEDEKDATMAESKGASPGVVE